QLRLAGCILIGVPPSRVRIAKLIKSLERIEEAIERMELGEAAVLQSRIDPEPVVPLIADAAAAERRGIEPALVQETQRRGGEEIRMRDFLQELVAGSDIPPEIPAAGDDGDGDRGTHTRKSNISGKRRRAHERGHSRKSKGFCTTHGFILSCDRG